MNECFVHRSIKRYRNTGDVIDRVRSCSFRSFETRNAIQTVRLRINHYPLSKQKIVAREMKISARSVSHMIHDDLGMCAYKPYTSYLLAE